MACSPLMSKDSVTVPSFHPAVAPDVTKQPRMSWLLGHRPAVRVAVQDVLSAIVAYVVGSILLCIGGAHGIIPVWISVSLISAYIVCWGAVYVLVRSGWSQRLADPHLTFVRVFIDLGAMTLAHALVPIVRGATLQLLCSMMAFYMGRLNQRQILGTSFMAVCLMLATLLGLWLTQPEHITLSVEILNLVMCSVLLPIAGFVGGEVYRIYQRSAAQRDQLQLTLTQLNHLSTRDSLTDLANRRHMLTLLDEEIRRQRRNGQTFCIGLLDIDLFKLVNDTHGHPVGDQVLKGFANLATRSIGAADTLARWEVKSSCCCCQWTTSTRPTTP
jgi:predicted signal transduction protein with EAL and GGDEF domain